MLRRNSLPLKQLLVFGTCSRYMLFTYYNSCLSAQKLLVIPVLQKEYKKVLQKLSFCTAQLLKMPLTCVYNFSRLVYGHSIFIILNQLF